MKTLLSKPFRPQGRNPLWARFQPPAPGDWGLKRVADLGDTLKGRLPRDLSPTPSDGAKPYFLIEGLLTGKPQGYTSEANLPECLASDTVVVADGSRSGLAIIGRSGILGSTLLAIRAKDGVNSLFVFYLVESLYEFLNKAPTGGAIPHLDQNLLARLVLAIPSDPAEQARIAETLKAADEHIRALEDQIRKAERVSVALDQQVFAVGRHAARFPYEFGLPRTIPHGWPSKRLGEIADVTSGVTINQDREPGENRVRYLTVVNVYRGRIDLTEERYLESRGNEAETKRLNKNDILVVEGHANPYEIGRAALVSEREAGMSFQNHLFRVRLPNEDGIRARFLVRALNSERVRRHWVAIANTSSGLSTINRTALRRLVVPVPTPDEQDVGIERIEEAERFSTALREQLTAARRVKQSLLQNLLTGRIRLKP